MPRTLLLAGLLLAPCLVLADTIIVTSTADAGSGTLRQAVLDASPGDAINFSPALSGTTITLSTEISINKALTIAGLGPALLTIAGRGTNRLFNIGTSGDVTLANVRLTGGKSNNVSTGGGAIFSRGTLEVENCVIENNSAFNDGGGIYSDGGGLTVTHSLIKGNTAGNGVVSGGSGGGIFSLDTRTRILYSTIEDNRSNGGSSSPQCGGGIYVEMQQNASADKIFRLEASTVSANRAGDRGAGVCMTTSGSTLRLRIRNATISGNIAQGNGGGLYVNVFTSLEMIYGTVAGNTAASGGGMFINVLTDTRLLRSIFADNTAATGPDVQGNPLFNFSNLITSPVLWVDPTDRVVTNAGLGPLADNGGPTLTHLPNPTSPAIDLVVDTSQIETVDQRGFSNDPTVGRCVDLPPIDPSAPCDAGAVEAGAVEKQITALVSGRAFLQGPYVDAATPFNSTGHSLNGRLPVNQPFSGPPWNYSGTETWSGATDVSDWVLIEQRETPDGPAVHRTASFVRDDGLISESGSFSMVPATIGYPPYYIVVRFRNHLDLISPLPISSIGTEYVWTAHPETGRSYNLEATVDAGTFFAARAGDMDADNLVTGLDILNVWATQSASSGGYFLGDLDFDGDVDESDLLLLWLPNNGW